MPHSSQTEALSRTSSSRTSSRTVRTLLLRTLAVILALVLGLYGLMAIDMGRVNSAPVFGDGQQLAQERLATTAAVEAGRENQYTDRAWRTTGIWMAMMSEATSPRYAYGHDSYFSGSFVRYALMPKSDMIILSLHNVLGGLCMLFGALQFWPAFRRNYPRWHRSFGAVYMVACQLAMIMAAVYLTVTPAADIYDSFSFYIGLWVLVIVATGSLWMSIYHLRRREIAQHQAYMAINFGALLTAPLLRYDWILFGMLFPGHTFNTVNYLGAGILLPQSFISAYLLLCITRSFQPLRPPVKHEPQPGLKPVLVGLVSIVALAGIVTTVQHFLLTPGLSQVANAQTLIPAGMQAIDQIIIVGNPALRSLFTASLCSALVLGSLFLWLVFASRGPQTSRWSHRVAQALTVTAATSSAILLYWGWQLGGPSAQTLSGGTHAALYGVLGLLFSTLLASALWRRRDALIKEWAIFSFGLMLSTPVFYWLLALLDTMPISAHFVAEGHVYRLAADAGPAGMLIALLYAVYGAATREKFAR